MAKTNKEKLDRLYKELDDMALRLGFESTRRPGCGNRNAILLHLLRGVRNGKPVAISVGDDVRQIYADALGRVGVVGALAQD